MAIEYERLDSGTLRYRRTVGDRVIALTADDVRKERTGIHAHITIWANTTILEEDTFNIGRREERNRLSNAAYKLLKPDLNGSADAFPDTFLQHELMLFCRGLWPAHIGDMRGELMAGDAAVSEPSFLIQDYVLTDGGTLIFAPPGAGKSWTGLLMAVSVDAGVSAIWRVRQAPVLYINLERGEKSFRRRLGLVNRVLGLPPERALRFINARGKTLADAWDGAERTVAEEGIGLVVLDSLSRSGVGDMNENAPANRAMDQLNGLCPSWMALAHTPRADASHVYGSQMFDAAADLGVQMLTEDGPHGDPLDEYSRLGIGLRVAKANDTAKPPLRIWAYEFDRRFGLANVRSASPNEFPAIEDSSAPQTVESQIVATLLRESLTNQELAQHFGVDAGYMSRVLKPLKEAGRVIEVDRVGNSIRLGIPNKTARFEEAVD